MLPTLRCGWESNRLFGLAISHGRYGVGGSLLLSSTGHALFARANASAVNRTGPVRYCVGGILDRTGIGTLPMSI
jgi:hypothetical protein